MLFNLFNVFCHIAKTVICRLWSRKISINVWGKEVTESVLGIPSAQKPHNKC